MKLKILLACIVCFIFENSHADPLGTAFTYQGQLIANGLPANGTYDFIFALYNSASSGSEIGTPVVTNGLSVSNGLFTTSIDFGTQFNGTATWLAISVRTNNNPSGYNLLTPRQPLTPAPNALFASTSANATTASSVVNGVITTGTYADPAWITSLAGSKITGNIGGNAANITGMLPASQLSGAIPTTQLSGTLSNGQLANSSVTVSAGAGLSGGGSVSLGGTTTVSANLNHDATLTGNGGTANLGLNLGNANTWTASQTMNGGLQVTGVIFATELAIGGAGTLSGPYATLAGGYYNTVLGEYATIAGGSYNTAAGLYAAVGGGYNNTASNGVVGGSATVGGGTGNKATNDCATVPGGHLNVAGGMNSFAAGTGAQALNTGTFVWCDGSNPTASTANSQFMARASGGFFFYTGSGTAGATLPANQTSWTTMSDRNAKKNFQSVDTVAVLNKLATIPIQQWNYKWEDDTDVPNIGPMAQDFKQAFYPGRDDKGISTLEFDGVELAAIQGLNQKVEEKAAKIQEQAAEIQSLRQDLAELKKLVQTIAEKK